MPPQWLIKVAAAVAPVLLGALVTIGWQNSHTLAVLNAEVANSERELEHLRELIESRQSCVVPPK